MPETNIFSTPAGLGPRNGRRLHRRRHDHLQLRFEHSPPLPDHRRAQEDVVNENIHLSRSLVVGTVSYKVITGIG